MPRTQRVSTLSHGWSAGVLSPAMQDQPDKEEAFTGAADIQNFEIQRDGGLSGRPPFVRSGFTFSNPSYNALAQSGINRDGLAGHLRIEGGSPVIGEDGIHALVPQQRIGDGDMAAQNAARAEWITGQKSLYEVAIEEQVNLTAEEAALRPQGDQDRERGIKYIVWHDVRVATTPPEGSVAWQTRQGNPMREEPNFVAFYTLGPGFTSAGTPANNEGRTPAPRFARFPSGHANAGDYDPLSWGAFSPGRVPRDIVIPVRRQEQGARQRSITRAGIRLHAANQSLPVTLLVGGVSVYTHQDLGANRRVWTRGSQPAHRIISWVVGDLPLVLVLSLEGVQAFHVGPQGVLSKPGEQLEQTWYFTPRQLRELAWVSYGKGILLTHQDFPWPLQVQMVAGTQLSVDYLRLKNVPEEDTVNIAGSAVSVSELIRVSLPMSRGNVGGGVGGRQQAAARTRYAPPVEATPPGPAVGRARVAADSGAIHPEPIVVSRELVISEQTEAEGAPPLQAVPPRQITLESPSPGMLEASWAATGASAYDLYVRTTATFTTSQWTGITPIRIRGTGTVRHTLSALQDGTVLAGGTGYTAAVQAVVIVGTQETASDFSPTASATVLHPAPAQPQNPTATASRDVEGQATFQWDPVPDADLYYVELRVRGTMLWVLARLQPETTFTFTGGIPGEDYELRVRGDRENAPDGTWTDPVDLALPDLRPAVPAGFSVTASLTDAGANNTSWTKSHGATGYVVEYRREDTDQWQATEDLGDVDTWAHTGLTLGDTWEYRVKAVRSGARDGFWSAVEEWTVGLPKPPPMVARYRRAGDPTPGLRPNCGSPSDPRPCGEMFLDWTKIEGIRQYEWQNAFSENTANPLGDFGLLSDQIYPATPLSVYLNWAVGFRYKFRYRLLATGLPSGFMPGPWSDESNTITMVTPGREPATPPREQAFPAPTGARLARGSLLGSGAYDMYLDWQAPPGSRLTGFRVNSRVRFLWQSSRAWRAWSAVTHDTAAAATRYNYHSTPDRRGAFEVQWRVAAVYGTELSDYVESNVETIPQATG